MLVSFAFSKDKDTPLNRVVAYSLGVFFTTIELRIIFKCQELCGKSAKCVLITGLISSLAFFCFFIAELWLIIDRDASNVLQRPQNVVIVEK